MAKEGVTLPVKFLPHLVLNVLQKKKRGGGFNMPLLGFYPLMVQTEV